MCIFISPNLGLFFMINSLKVGLKPPSFPEVNPHNLRRSIKHVSELAGKHQRKRQREDRILRGEIRGTKGLFHAVFDGRVSVRDLGGKTCISRILESLPKRTQHPSLSYTLFWYFTETFCQRASSMPSSTVKSRSGTRVERPAMSPQITVTYSGWLWRLFRLRRLLQRSA